MSTDGARRAGSPSGDLTSRLRRMTSRRSPDVAMPPSGSRPGQALIDLIGAEELTTEFGRYLCVHQEYATEHSHGILPLGSIANASLASLSQAAGDDTLNGQDLASAAFVDIETTGLSRGAGTYAFLVGIGYLADGAYHVHQFFMPDYPEEPAMLSAVASILIPFKLLVTFNGIGFDIPILRSRFTCARLPLSLHGIRHLDLLYPARRLWRDRLSSCSLSVLEEEILEVRRTEEDTPGWLIPQLYFDYLTAGEVEPIGRVFYHNAQDILSLVTLAAHLCRVFNDPFGGHLTHGSEFASLGRAYERAGMTERCVTAYQRALSDGLEPHIRHKTLQRLGLVYKRLGRWPEAVAVWQQQLDGTSVSPYVELAKYYEHRARDYERAIEIVDRAVELGQSPGAGMSLPVRSRLESELSHRRERLERKVRRRTRCRS